MKKWMTKLIAHSNVVKHCIVQHTRSPVISRRMYCTLYTKQFPLSNEKEIHKTNKIHTFARLTTEKSCNHITRVFSCSMQHNECDCAEFMMHHLHKTHIKVFACKCVVFDHTYTNMYCILIATFPFFVQHTSIFMCV